MNMEIPNNCTVLFPSDGRLRLKLPTYCQLYLRIVADGVNELVYIPIPDTRRFDTVECILETTSYESVYRALKKG